MKKYVCGICGYIYDEAAGIPASGIAPGTRWEELPQGWVCPWCGASKDMFKEQAGAADPNPADTNLANANPTDTNPTDTQPTDAQPTDVEPTDAEEDGLRELAAGELSALCSNLAKGCEKQYLKEEQELFLRLADYFKKRVPKEKNADIRSMKFMAERDLAEVFPLAEGAAGEEPDRGALRALVWSKKVTTMVSSLLSRYEKEGEGFLEHTNIYVCDICGFIYVGDTPPDVCPVCKVPNWKMSNIERRQ